MRKENRKKLSIVVPCYNEEENIEPFYREILKLKEKLQDILFELLFVDDGSKDATYQKIVALHNQDEMVKGLTFSRNFGKEAAIFAGLRSASGDCCVVMDADLQHPPETIMEMYQYWLQGYEIVEGIKTYRGKETSFHRGFAHLFYSLISKIVGIDMNNSSDYKLLDRKVIDVLNCLNERNTFFRALSYWVGYKSISVSYEVHERKAGKTKWSIKALLRYALRNMVSFTYAPLYLIAILGMIILILGLFLGIDAIVSFCNGISVSGYPTLVLLETITSGGIMLSLGVIGIYIAKIYDEVKKRPQYIIRERI